MPRIASVPRLVMVIETMAVGRLVVDMTTLVVEMAATCFQHGASCLQGAPETVIESKMYCK